MNMLFSFRILIPTCLLFLLPLGASAQQGHNHHGHHHHDHGPPPELLFIENKGQLHENALYDLPLGGVNRLFLEKDAFSYVLYDEEAGAAMHDVLHRGSSGEKEAFVLPGHAYRVRFKGASAERITALLRDKRRFNYFRGKDPDKWATDVSVFKEVLYEDMYEGVDLLAYSQAEHFKYDFIVSAGADASQIAFEFEGADGLELKGGHLLVRTSVGTTRESKPYAYQIIDGKTKEVPCDYHLEGGQVTFHFPKGYDKTKRLVIDPIVVAATLTGTTISQNFGHTATYDNAGNIYAGGICFGAGYPVTTGAFQQSFAGGTSASWPTDMVVSKYNPDGTNLIYATYIGGSGDDYPHSMIVDANNQLCILGSTDSNNFPVLSNAYQTAKGGDIDITLVKLNASGTALVGSTYLGGTGRDGVNVSTLDVSYGENNRGEIMLDGQGNIYVAATSSSSNFPTTTNAYQENKSGGQDGVVFKMNSDLSTLFWSTFLGGSNNDTAGGLKIDDAGNTVVVGTAGSSSFPMVSGGYQTWPGGSESAYVAVISPNGQQMIRGTYWGTSNGNDHGYFVDIDEDNNIHMFGTTTGTGLPHTPGSYSNIQNSPQYLVAFTPQLNDLVYSTTIGLGNYSGVYNLVPIAFMVDKCNNIYFSGYYAQSGLPLTPDAIWTSGNTFYLGVLTPNAGSLSFGTYYGKSDHVDGGTSRFDKSGIVYQGVCSCDENVLNTLPGSWATGQQERCDIGVFKIDFEKETVTAALQALPASSGCAPYTVDLKYTGQDGEQFLWAVDGDPFATTPNTTYTFTEPGSYDVMLVAEAGSTCNVRDTAFLQIDVLAGTSTFEELSFCPGEDFLFLDASTVNATYEWQDGSTGATYSVSEPGMYWVDIMIPGCEQRDSFEVFISSEISVDLGESQTLCDLPSYTLDASHPAAAEYTWSTGETTPSISFGSSGNYAVTVSDQYGCTVEDATQLTFQVTPVFSLEDTLICEGETVTLSTNISDADYLWSDGSTGNTLVISDVGTYSLTLDNGCVFSEDMTLSLSLNPFDIDVQGVLCFGDCNGSITANLIPGENLADLIVEWGSGAQSLVQTNLCPGDYPLTVTDEEGCVFDYPLEVTEPDEVDYSVNWNDVTCFGDGNGGIQVDSVTGGTPPFLYAFDTLPFSSNPSITGLDGGTYSVDIMDANGCAFYEEVDIFEPAANYITAGPDKYITLGDSVLLEGYVAITAGHDIYWAEAPGMWDYYNIRPTVTPVNTTEYVIYAENRLTGCVISDSVTVFLDKPRAIYIPNVFTPNGDGFNDGFTIYSNQGIRQIRYLRIYDRWGELVFEGEDFPSNTPSLGWQGDMKGQMMNPAVFVYVAEVEFLDDYVRLYKGDVTLLR